MRFIAILCLIIATSLSAKDKKPKKPVPPPQDAIEVIAHIPLKAGSVRRFLATEHLSSRYLYVEYDAGANMTLIDVTKPGQPAVLTEVAYPMAPGHDSLVLVSGTTALVTSDGVSPPAAQQPAAQQTIRILDLSDPQHPKVAREFTGVTAINRDDGRGLIYLANSEGVWILHQNRAQDPDLEKAYAHHVLYDH
jgi:hypothetical protein